MPGPSPDQLLEGVPAQLKRLRTERKLTLDALAAMTGISKSTLSRLESGQRKPTLELLLRLTSAYQVPIDELIGTSGVADPRVHSTPVRRDGTVVIPLSRQAGPQRAFKMVLPARRRTPRLVTHEGYEWLYVLSGRLRLVLAHHDLELGPGEAAEFDTRQPHWFGSAGHGPVEILSLFGSQGQRVHLRTGQGPT